MDMDVSSDPSPDPPVPNDGYWIEDGRLLGGPYPGAPNPAQARDRLAGLVAFGVRTFLDLTEADEGLQPYARLLGAVEEEHRLEVELLHVRMPIGHRSVPTLLGMTATLALIDHLATSRDGCVYVHCRDGVGRTGVVAGCRLIEQGTQPARALDRLAALRAHTTRAARPSPETEAQRRFVEGWRGAR